ncbi:uncharacterized protein LOC108743238 [Agrilus planipennis]|uniref:Uncharacterized protein LOC108743238 n=1 Tax=Agrilus planipennis TaxID=224129 RepID=A0A1W4XN61_AGRPL|nr:uncharacterized protein LOC108743238 [Agrilus planipennis]
MPLISKKKFRPQRVIIPKGLVDPEEVTILEIPLCLKDEPVVIARKKNFHPNDPHSEEGNDRISSACSSQVSLPLSYDQNNRPNSAKPGNLRPSSVCGNCPNRTSTPFSPSLSPEQLQTMEKEECAALLNDLNQFQQARRNLILHTTSFASHPTSSSFINNNNNNKISS